MEQTQTTNLQTRDLPAQTEHHNLNLTLNSIKSRSSDFELALKEISMHVGNNLGINFGWEKEIIKDGKVTKEPSLSGGENRFTGKGLCDGASFAIQEAISSAPEVSSRVVCMQTFTGSDIPTDHFLVEVTSSDGVSKYYIDPTYRQVDPLYLSFIAIHNQADMPKSYQGKDLSTNIVDAQDRKQGILDSLVRYGFTQQDYSRLVKVFQTHEKI